MEYKALYENKVWDVVTLFFESESMGARLERVDKTSYPTTLVAFPSRSQFKLLRNTGLKDKNGTDIFEYDLIGFTMQGKEIVELVMWDRYHSGFLPFSRPIPLNDNYIDAGHVEVIGCAFTKFPYSSSFLEE